MTQEDKGSSAANRPGKGSPGMGEKRVFINDNGQGTFICPACDKGVIKDLSEFIQTPSAIRLKCKCSCGNRYRVLVERRRHFRKAVNLTGRFLFHNSQAHPVKGLIKVLDISQSGVCFSVNSIPEFQVGDKLTIEFNLDDEDRSEIREVGTVQRIQTNIIGLTFKTTDHYGKLGQYLFR